jgi:hypothetical protein
MPGEVACIGEVSFSSAWRVEIPSLGYRIETRIQYVPQIRPEPASLLRQVAYHDRKPVPGPELDPEGWVTFPSVNHTGKLFNGLQSTIQCTVSSSYFCLSIGRESNCIPSAFACPTCQFHEGYRYTLSAQTALF